MGRRKLDSALDSALAKVLSGLPGGGEPRPGQLAMAEAVEGAIAGRRHLVVQAGTGTGKSLAYLVPAVLSGRKVVVATATKALQDQLADKDLPLVAARVGRPVAFAVVKGRSNYLCRQRCHEIAGGADQAGLELAGEPAAGRPGARPAGRGAGQQVRRMLSWAERTATGDRADLDFEPSARAWASVSVSSLECPGAHRCPSGDECFAEAARARAAEADVVVVNSHLYGADLASGGAVLPPHDVVVFDEAHELEDVMSASLGREVSSRRLRSLSRAVAALLPGEGSLASELSDAADRIDARLADLVGTRIRPGVQDAAFAAMELAGQRVSRALGALRRAGDGKDRPDYGDGRAAGRGRALVSAEHLGDDLAAFGASGPDDVCWVEGARRDPVARMAPVEVGPLLAEGLWGRVTAVLTSATIPPGLAPRVGIEPGACEELDVGSPFPFSSHGLLYCAAHLPDRRQPGSDEAAHRELASLVCAAGGRTLALFTSWRAMEAAAGALARHLPYRILTQADLPKPALVEAFSAEESACLFATMGFWQGVDVPGPTLSLVVIDRLPFPRPDDPLFQAKRDRAGTAAFRAVDLPRAAALLAQGAGRLIRSSEDTGVVAVLDPRLAKASYRWDLVAALPPMSRTRRLEDVETFLAGRVNPGPARPRRGRS